MTHDMLTDTPSLTQIDTLLRLLRRSSGVGQPRRGALAAVGAGNRSPSMRGALAALRGDLKSEVQDDLARSSPSLLSKNATLPPR